MSKKPCKPEQLDDIWIIARVAGAKSAGMSQREKYMKDADILIDELKKNPADTRNQFYLAQSYRDAGETHMGLEHYRKRVMMGGWAEEVFYAQYQVAKLMMILGYPYERFLPEFLRAYEFVPRWEPIFHIMSYCRRMKWYRQGYMFGKCAISLPPPKEILLFREEPIYDYLFYDEYAVCAYWAGDHADCEKYCSRLVEEKKIPEKFLDRVKKNLHFSRVKLGMIDPKTPVPSGTVGKIEEPSGAILSVETIPDTDKDSKQEEVAASKTDVTQEQKTTPSADSSGNAKAVSTDSKSVPGKDSSGDQGDKSPSGSTPSGASGKKKKRRKRGKRNKRG
jgi:hypothetical protein